MKYNNSLFENKFPRNLIIRSCKIDFVAIFVINDYFNESYNDGVMISIIVAAVCEMVDTLFVFGVITSLMYIIKKRKQKY